MTAFGYTDQCPRGSKELTNHLDLLVPIANFLRPQSRSSEQTSNTNISRARASTHKPWQPGFASHENRKSTDFDENSAGFYHNDNL
jgi:hypothetical protein